MLEPTQGPQRVPARVVIAALIGVFLLGMNVQQLLSEKPSPKWYGWYPPVFLTVMLCWMSAPIIRGCIDEFRTFLKDRHAH